jgi:WD40 repeat protein
MDIIFLLKVAFGLTVLLIVLIYFLFAKPKKKTTTKPKPKPIKPKVPTDLKYLSNIIKNRDISSDELQETLDLVLKYHGDIPKKIGTNNHPNFIMYEDIIYAICRHPNTNSKIVSGFTSSLEKRNDQYRSQINDALTKGLNSRVI